MLYVILGMWYSMWYHIIYHIWYIVGYRMWYHMRYIISNHKTCMERWFLAPMIDCRVYHGRDGDGSARGTAARPDKENEMSLEWGSMVYNMRDWYITYWYILWYIPSWYITSYIPWYIRHKTMHIPYHNGIYRKIMIYHMLYNMI